MPYKVFGRFVVLRKALRRIRFLLRSNYGRQAGWYVTLNGKSIAELEYDYFMDMFWDIYEVTYDEEHQGAIKDPDNWEQCKFKYVNKESGEAAEHAFCGGDYRPFCSGEQENISMRGLYLKPANSAERFWERLLLPHYRKQAKREKMRHD